MGRRSPTPTGSLSGPGTACACPPNVIERPEGLTVEHIQAEGNVEIRRVMFQRYGQERYLRAAGAQGVHADHTGVLWRCEIPGDEPLVMVEVRNSTPEPDGTHRTYWLRVPPRPALHTRRLLGVSRWTRVSTPPPSRADTGAGCRRRVRDRPGQPRADRRPDRRKPRLPPAGFNSSSTELSLQVACAARTRERSFVGTRSDAQRTSLPAAQSRSSKLMRPHAAELRRERLPLSSHRVGSFTPGSTSAFPDGE